MKTFRYKNIQTHNTAGYYKMELAEYYRLTNHILRTIARLFERKNKKIEEHRKLIEVLTAPCFDRHKSKYGTEQSISDILHGITEKINNTDNIGRLNSADISTAQIDNFNECLRTLGAAYDDHTAMKDYEIEMLQQTEQSTEDFCEFGNGLFSID